MSQRSARQTRQRLAQVRAQQARAERRRRMLAVAGAGVVAVGLVTGIAYGVAQSRQNAPQATGPGPGSAVWPVPADPGPGVKAAGLNLGPMGTADHYHAHLDIFVDGKPVTVPANIGVDARSGAMSAVHTHDTRGVIHIEAHTKGDRYTLGQVFTQWRQPLSASRLGPLTTGGGTALTAYVDGKKAAGDPAAIVVAPHQQIALVYGRPDAPFTPPASYRFQPGE